MPTTIKVGLLKDSAAMRDRLRRDYFKVLTEKANQAHAFAINLAEDSLHASRPASRRSRLTKGKKHYADSFVVIATENSRHRVRVELRNTSPISHIIERGSRPHVISARDKTVLKFPTPTARGQQRTGFDRGRFAVEGPPFFTAAVKHPGGRKFQILLRTARAVRNGTIARGTGIRSGR